MPNITPCLWFDGNAEEAMRFYTSIFKDSKAGPVTRYGKAMPGKEGSVMTASFEIGGQEFLGLNGGPDFKFNEAISLQINCQNQEEIDYYWDKLSKGGDPKAQVCGWLKDKFGLSWQVIPAVMSEMFKDHNSPEAQRTMEAMLRMKKINIKELERAGAGDKVTA